MRCLAFAFALLSAGIVAGCLALPVEYGEAEPFENNPLDFIRVGESTKGDIAAAMSQLTVPTRQGEQVLNLQPLEFRQGDTWLYGAARSESRWFVLDFYLFSSDPPVRVTDTLDYRFLLIDFDENGVVRSYQRSRSEGLGCNDFGVCANGPAHMLLDPDGKDASHQRIDASAEACRVYLYASGLHVGAPVWLDKNHQGWLVNVHSYLSWDLAPGSHRLQSRMPEENYPVDLYFECAAGELLFVDLEQKIRSIFTGRWHTTIEQREDGKGRKAVAKRKRLLAASHVPEPQPAAE